MGVVRQTPCYILHAISIEMHVKLHTPVLLSEVSDVMAIFSNGPHWQIKTDRLHPLAYSTHRETLRTNNESSLFSAAKRLQQVIQTGELGQTN